MNKKTIILASVSVLLIILIIILSLTKPKSYIETNRLKDDNKFFQINSAINEEYGNEELSYSFLATEIYYQENDLLTTYFIKGFSIKGELEQEYKNNEYYLLKTQGASYKLNKLNNVINIKEYADNYIEDEKSIDSTRVLPSPFYNEKNKLFYYLTVFSYLLSYNPKEAYNYLSENQKNKYNSYYDFENKASNINSNLSIAVDYFSKKTEKNEIVYSIKTNEIKDITIYEKGIMDFTIEY